VDNQSPVANVATHTRVETTTSQAAEPNTSQRKPALKVPTLPAWDNQNGEDNINIFLPRLAQYLRNQGISQKDMPLNVYPFLKGKAFQLWQLEADSLTHTDTELTWELFEKFMKDTFGIVAPERQARQQYDRLVHKGSVFKYVSEIKRLVHVMKPLPMVCPGEADIVHHFVKNAKAPLQDWLKDHCPPGYWTSAAEVFEKAIQFGNNNEPPLKRRYGTNLVHQDGTYGAKWGGM
jgi:hypothetical protein